jgi:hypothetical protein
LRHILGILVVAQHPIAKPEHRALELIHEFQNGRTLPPETAIDESAEFVSQAGTSLFLGKFAFS